MKKCFYFALAALVALAGCEKENDAPAVSGKSVRTISISIPETKATIADSGSGAATFAWEKGDRLGVAVGSRLVEFTLADPDESPARFTAELEEGEVVEDGAYVAYPYVAEDCVDGAFEVSFPSTYEIEKADDFRLRWAGTLSKQENGTFAATLEHTSAILRVTFSTIPTDAAAVVMTADDNAPVTVKFSEDMKESATYTDMSFYLPLQAGSYEAIAIDLATSDGTTIAGSRQTLSSKSGQLTVENGKIYRTPSIEYNLFYQIKDASTLGNGEYVIAYRNGTSYKLFSFEKTMANAKAAAASVADVHGLGNLLSKGSALYSTVLGGNFVEIEAEENAAEILVPASASEAIFTATGTSTAGKVSFTSENGDLRADRVIVDLNDDGSARIAAAFNAEDIVTIMKSLRGTDIPVTFQYLIDFAVEEAAKEGVTFTDEQVTRLETGFEHLCSLAKQVLADHNMGTLMDIDLSTNVLDVFARYYDNVTDYSLQISEEKKFGWAVPMGFYAADNGFTFNVSVPNYGWFNRLNASLKGKTKDECVEYWHQFDSEYNIAGFENFFQRLSRRALNELSDSTYEMLQQLAAEDKFITIGQVYKKYVDRFNDDLEEVYIYKKY